MKSTRIQLAIWLTLFVFLVFGIGLAGYLVAAPADGGFMLTILISGSVLALVLALVVFRAGVLPLMRILRYARSLEAGNYGVAMEGGDGGESGKIKAALGVVAEAAGTDNQQCGSLEKELAAANEDISKLRKELGAAEESAEAQSRALIMGASKLKELAELLAESTDGLSSQVTEVADGATEQRKRSTESATAMDQMNSSIMDVARNASLAAEQANAAREKAISGASVMNQVSNAVDSTNEHTHSMSQSVNGLGKQAENIGKIMGVITDIADQTNLLALNAAIEAARAGEAGRGFAVVADEVRKLAEKTMVATKDVGEAVQGIQGGINGAINEMGLAAKAVEETSRLTVEADAALQEIVGIAEVSADQAQAIATAAEEQSAVSEEITQAVDEVCDTSSSMEQGMADAREMLDNVSSYTSVLTAIIEDMADGDMTSIERRDLSALHTGASRNPVVSEDACPTIKRVKSPASVPSASPKRTAFSAKPKPNGSLMEWGPSFVLGINEIDDQHKRLVGLVNALNNAMKTGKGTAKLGQIFEELKEYTVHHFATEEAYFEETNYPGTIAHVAKHKKLVNQVLELEKDFKRGKTALTTDVMNFLNDWLVKHIQGDDAKYVPHLQRAGVGAKPASVASSSSGNGASLMEWGPSFELGIREIDEQHRRLVELVNALNNAMKTGQGTAKLGGIFEELKEYTVHHFSTEEALFEETNYPGSIAHVAKHKKLVNQVLDLEKDFKRGKTALTNDVMLFLKDWLVKHIQGDDAKYVPHLKKAGIY